MAVRAAAHMRARGQENMLELRKLKLPFLTKIGEPSQGTVRTASDDLPPFT
ncbi:hypothetical protein SESBI_31765 [Sesbania bispinosa]|nr:hypothetical protein SESBI_31765 [Sesbania bispinosa]